MAKVKPGAESAPVPQDTRFEIEALKAVHGAIHSLMSPLSLVEKIRTVPTMEQQAREVESSMRAVIPHLEMTARMLTARIDEAYQARYSD
jgi:hypothetical protein